MKTILLLLVACITLSGCYQSVDSYDIKRAIKHCGSFENVHEIYALSSGAEKFVCFEDNLIIN